MYCRLPNLGILEAIGYGLLISVVVIVARLIIALLSAQFTHWVSRYIAVGDANPGWRGPSWSC
ncbi:hypothetical protein GCM10011383_14120 [Hymenobacter cavernae]|uniref:Uncharacterized protein n=1 Tax=Hymenobacter cavernae TaxID=2044852 RepID=A0ABQ1TX72_9BACT|nr:hypothetical protein GCM10011383_14120 [Hymenobacter cavernae]